MLWTTRNRWVYDIALLKTRKQMKAVSPKVEDQPPARAAECILKWGAECLMCKISSKLGESEGKHFLEEQECNNEITDYILLSKPHDIGDFAQVIIKFCWVEIWSVWCHGLVLKNTKLLEKPPPPSKPKNVFSESPLIGCLNIFRGPPQYLNPPSPLSQSY